jgi:hypothetical protein
VTGRREGIHNNITEQKKNAAQSSTYISIRTLRRENPEGEKENKILLFVTLHQTLLTIVVYTIRPDRSIKSQKLL